MTFSKMLLTVVAIFLPASSYAITIDFSGGIDYQMSRQYSVDGLNLTVKAYTGGNSSRIQQTIIGSYGANGLGAEYAWTPEHAIDNANSNFDMLMFTFDRAVSLDSTSIGWWQKDSDMTILAYTGTGNAADTFKGKTWGQAITTQNWSGGHFIDVAQHGGTVASNPLELTSTSWLVGTFLEPVDKLFQRFGKAIGGFGADYVKVKSISVSEPHEVPEIDGNHAGIALALLAGLIACARERRRAVVAA